MPSLAGMPEDDDEPPVNAILRRAEAVLKAHDVGKPKGGGTLPEDPYEVLRECSEWVAKLADMVCSECQGSARLQAENARLQELLRGVGANRYWEGRWRDAEAENASLLASIERLQADRSELTAGVDKQFHQIERLRTALKEAKELIDEGESGYITGTGGDTDWNTRAAAFLRAVDHEQGVGKHEPSGI